MFDASLPQSMLHVAANLPGDRCTRRRLAAYVSAVRDMQEASFVNATTATTGDISVQYPTTNWLVPLK